MSFRSSCIVAVRIQDVDVAGIDVERSDQANVALAHRLVEAVIVLLRRVPGDEKQSVIIFGVVAQMHGDVFRIGAEIDNIPVWQSPFDVLPCQDAFIFFCGGRRDDVVSRDVRIDVDKVQPGELQESVGNVEGGCDGVCDNSRARVAVRGDRESAAFAVIEVEIVRKVRQVELCAAVLRGVEENNIVGRGRARDFNRRLQALSGPIGEFDDVDVLIISGELEFVVSRAEVVVFDEVRQWTSGGLNNAGSAVCGVRPEGAFSERAHFNVVARFGGEIDERQTRLGRRNGDDRIRRFGFLFVDDGVPNGARVGGP